MNARIWLVLISLVCIVLKHTIAQGLQHSTKDVEKRRIEAAALLEACMDNFKIPYNGFCNSSALAAFDAEMRKFYGLQAGALERIINSRNVSLTERIALASLTCFNLDSKCVGGKCSCPNCAKIQTPHNKSVECKVEYDNFQEPITASQLEFLELQAHYLQTKIDLEACLDNFAIPLNANCDLARKNEVALRFTAKLAQGVHALITLDERREFAGIFCVKSAYCNGETCVCQIPGCQPKPLLAVLCTDEHAAFVSAAAKAEITFANNSDGIEDLEGNRNLPIFSENMIAPLLPKLFIVFTLFGFTTVGI